jgi:anion-transporting  ArsA/GET3 family ATPase
VTDRTLDHAVSTKRILVCVGSGGVGKTTTAAALGLAAARRGRRTLVITIDPARRLANSLGLDRLGHEVRLVDPAVVSAGATLPPPPRGELHAMMLDQKKAFDEVVARYARDPAAVGRILGNPIYAQISGTLAGAHEYAAMAKLQELDATGAWDLIVIDTPPTAHALDFLDAPEKLTNAIDSPAIEWFRKLQGGSTSGWRVVGRTGAFIMRRLAKFVGSQFLDDVSVFFTEFHDILGGFRQRAEETMALLHQDKVGFVLVASPEPMAVQEALYFHERLARAAMPFVGFVVNKVHAGRPVAMTVGQVEKALDQVEAVEELELSATALGMAAEALIAAHTDLEVLAAADQVSIGRLHDAGGPGVALVEIPFFREDVHDVTRLAELGRYLVGRAVVRTPDA